MLQGDSRASDKDLHDSRVDVNRRELHPELPAKDIPQLIDEVICDPG